MQRSELEKIFNKIKNDYYIQTYIKWKDSENSYDYFNRALAYIAGICDVLALGNLIARGQVNKLQDTIVEYMETESSKHLDALFDEIRKEVKD